jgi:hypothetical protein
MLTIPKELLFKKEKANPFLYLLKIYLFFKEKYNLIIIFKSRLIKIFLKFSYLKPIKHSPKSR